ncbi:HAMP domain-containing sensor histidine kinase [Burkholderia sp. S171]|uniref:sensor histidine kinase n=1 Tax=Burkholderia sp. S171 TaxID=1641860 RepID=UPI00131C74DD|nr:HAMP domain-containing sensor histidine kinase [Burkholderia sp. S171]
MKFISPRTLSGRIIWTVMLGLAMWSAFDHIGWKNERSRLLLEIPARLAAAHIAQTVRTINSLPGEDANRAVQALSRPGFSLSWRNAASPPEHSEKSATESQQLVARAIRANFDGPLELKVLNARQFQAPDSRGLIFKLDGLQWQRGEFSVQVRMDDGRWLNIDCEEGEGGLSISPWWAFFRWGVPFVVFSSMLACLVRIAMRPLRAFAAAADDLAQNINRLPLTVAGPLELRNAIQALNNLQRKLLDYVGERTRILAAVSHDLKSPITRLRLRAEMLQDDDLRQRFRADLLEMETLANETLEFMRGIEVREPVRPIDVNALLDVVQSDAMEAGGEISISGAATRPLPGYARSLKRCLSNLVDNAVRYGERARILIRDESDMLEIVVSDDGPGIPVDHLSRVFEPFYRVEESRSRATGGSGLGLSIAQNIVLAHGGTLTLKNGGERGLEATLRFPRRRDCHA